MVRHVRESSWFEPLVDALDAIYKEKKCPDVKGVRDTLLLPLNICVLLLIAEFFCKFLQARSLNYSSIKNKLESIMEHLKFIQEGLEDYDAIGYSLIHFL